MSDTYSLAGKDVHRVGYGTMQLPGEGHFGPPRDHDAAIAVLQRAAELGVDHFDTSAFYGPWVSNDLLRESGVAASGACIVSKVGGRRGPDASWLAAQTPSELSWGIDENLIGLKVDRVDAINLRLMNHEDPSAPPELTPEFDEQLGAMQDAKEAGKIGGVGLSTISLAHLDRASELGVEIACVQNRYALTHRDDEDVLQACVDRDIAYVPYFPLDFGAVAADETVQRIAGDHGVTANQIGLAWLLAHAPNILLIPGTSSIEHLEENVAVGDISLSDEELAALDAVAS